ncbi:MAG: TlpA family protein disulfide reductase [Candidatus Coproplasma sp.]
MKFKRFLFILSACLTALTFTACSGTSDGTDITQNAVYYNEEYGLVIKQWTQPYQSADERFVETYSLASGYKDFNVFHAHMCEFARKDDAEEHCIVQFGYVIFSTNPDELKENADAVAALNEYRIACGDEPVDITFEKITTSNGRIIWMRRFAEPFIIQGEPTEEEESAIAAMYQGFTDQIRQLELVEAKPLTAKSKVTFTTLDLNADTVDSSVFANAELTMVNIWVSYCPYSIGEMADLMKLDAQMKDLQVITILWDCNSVDDSAAEAARAVVEKLNLTLPVYIKNSQISAVFPFSASPTSFLVDKEGNPVGVAYVGNSTAEQFAEWIAYYSGK